jgi:hypothetical protein
MSVWPVWFQWLWLPLAVFAVVGYFVMKPHRDKFRENRRREQAKPEKYHIT